MSGENVSTRLTVEEQPKVEALKKTEVGPSYFLPAMKCIVTCFMFLVVLGCAVFSKISVIAVAERLGKKSSETGPGKLFIMLTLILMVPQALSFIRAVWRSLRHKNRPWPTRKAIFANLVGSIFEVVGLCTFTMVTLSSKVAIKGNEAIAVMNCVSVVPTLWHVWKLRRNPDSSSQTSAIWKVVFLICGLVQLAGLGVIIGVTKPLDRWTYSVLSLLLISVAWLPKMRRWQMKPRLAPGVETEPEPEPDGDVMVHPGVFLHQINARAKATMISEGVKLLLTPFVGFLVCWAADLVTFSDLKPGFESLGNDHSDSAFKYFLVNVIVSFVGYLFSVVTCSMAIQKIGFALPLTLTTPVSFALVTIRALCHLDVTCDTDWQLGTPIVVVVWFVQFLSTTYYVWRSQDFIMAKEAQLFWVPSYNGVLLEQNLLLNRKNELTDEYFVNQNKLAKDSCIFICTTMYHEADHEMEQLLYSLHRVDKARQVSTRRIESHIWFDGAVKKDVLNNYVLQLISLVSKTMNVKVSACMKLETPYGMELRWRLPGGMNFHIHLKDNIKVKNKKRWSQVMYMSYVLDFKTKQMNVREEDTYILTTDADIMFNADSVEALLDLLMRDPKVGAVCGRTHPLGIGPLVWYQVFDYAIGHWFQKVANHVLGSVLCCPGCFSVYRAKALRDVLPLYASSADHAVDFLTKDMGEDRWLCTLMVQAGWRLEYCAAAENRTFCPDNFDEFYKQRRRWIPSTLANLALLISEWRITVSNNDTVSFYFILYQALNVFSTLISPAIVILLITGGLQYGWNFDPVTALVLLLLVSCFYCLVCLFTKQDVQLKTARVLTLLFALLMGAVVVGLVEQMVEKPGVKPTPTPTTPAPVTYPRPTTKKTTPTKKYDVLYVARGPYSVADPAQSSLPTANSSSSTTASPDNSEIFLGIGVSTWYFIGLVGVYMVTAMCHPTEAYCLLYGLLYLLCLPSGYLFLIIFSICNLTDRSWGTRENKVKTENEESLLKVISDKLIWLCRGCKDPDRQEQPAVAPINGDEETVTTSSSESDGQQSSQAEQNDDPEYESTEEIMAQSDNDVKAGPSSPSYMSKMPIKSALKKGGRSPSPGANLDGKKAFRYPGDRTVRFPAKLPTAKAAMAAGDWLEGKMKQYLPNFEENGYDDTSFIAKMNEQDLQAIGIDKRGHRKRLLQEIEQLPVVELDNVVPDRVDKWLADLGLHDYWLNFKNNSYDNPKALEDLKIMNKSELETTVREDLGVTKRGHVNKLVQAIAKLQYPSAMERKIREARVAINGVPLRSLKDEHDGVEFEFWTRLRELRLLPESKAFGQHSELSEKLAELRDSVVLLFVVANLLWIILIFTLTTKADLDVLEVNALGLAFLVVFGLIIVIQFLTMLWHRVSTSLHILARAPFRTGASSLKVWAFNDGELPPPPSEDELRRIRTKRLRNREKRRSREFLESLEEERPLLNGDNPSTGYRATSSGRRSPYPV